MEHTTGKLTFRGFSIYAADGKTPVADTCLNASVAQHDVANARRLVACWNACEGVPLDEVENLANIGGLNALTVEAGRAYADADALKAQRDELLAATQYLLDVLDELDGECDAIAEFQAPIRAARAVLAKHKGAEHG